MDRYKQLGMLAVVILAAVLLHAATDDRSRAGAAEPSIDPRTIPTVGTRDFSIRFRTDDAGGPITRVELWYTVDGGVTWQAWNVDAIRPGSTGGDSPEPYVAPDAVAFRAEADGLYGFYLILHNAAGASAPPPNRGTRPQQWVRVVSTAPLVKITSARRDERFDRTRQVHLRWEVIGDHLGERPVTLHVRTKQTRAYRLLADLQEAVGDFQWTVPDDISGRVQIKVSATDLAGNRGTAVYGHLDVDKFTTPGVVAGDKDATPATIHSVDTKLDPSRSMYPPHAAMLPHGEPDRRRAAVDDATAEKARQRYDQGTWHRLRGEHDLAIARYREAVELNAELHSARHDLAAVLILQGRLELAEAELRRLLSAEPEHRPALKSLALLQARRKDYRSASETLQTLLLLDPRDPEAWLYFGDASLFTGDRQAAWTAWQKINELEAATEEIKRRARTRLEMYQKGRLTPESVTTR